CGYFYRAAATDFKKIPGSPVAYWVSEQMLESFAANRNLGEYMELKAGMSTGDNTVFQRFWSEVEIRNIGFLIDSLSETMNNGITWYPCHSGGEFRKWYGNHEKVVNWQGNGEAIRNHKSSAVRNDSYYFREGITWTKISSGKFAARWRPKGFLFDDTGRCGFSTYEYIYYGLGILCSKMSDRVLQILSPTMSFTSGDIAKIPFHFDEKINQNLCVNAIVGIAKSDWDSYETSWDFTTLPLLQAQQPGVDIATIYSEMRQQWQAATLEMQRLEEENNRLFIAAYGLQDELTPDVPLSEITLTCNPHYRYSSNKSEAELEALLLADTMRELISYAVGCMFGRYSLDKPGLILANQGETVADYARKVSGNPSTDHRSPITDNRLPFTFPPDEDNAIPMLDGDWFSDDITERFKKFLRVTFGEAHYAENLAFIEAALGRDIRSYFLRDFYDHHVRMYKKRPIYWLFSSPKGSFNVLIYMHRYRPDTVSVVLNDYLREFRAKLEARKGLLAGVSASASSSPRDKTRALKEISDIDKTLKELRDYEDDVLYPLATRQVQIDLDDGVKVNYNKFGSALKRITGLSDS
ncbi:MAG: BREX-1 system adenine-specific DNA-methyltransferase PglX, partial [Candidatus Promineifilaceae bacterium]